MSDTSVINALTEEPDPCTAASATIEINPTTNPYDVSDAPLIFPNLKPDCLLMTHSPVLN
ncbi:MAG: hypothetical protein Alpg2KO_06030 [Alphaproteobacteria bacterium]